MPHAAALFAKFRSRPPLAEVAALFSPAYWPRYNGAIWASRTGHPGQWTWDDVSAARHEANATARPRALKQPTPDEGWQRRDLLTTAEREAFQANVQRYREELAGGRT